MPVALLGLACYVALFATALLRSENARLLHTALALTGVVFSTYLLYVQIELIGAVCQWCLASDGIMSGLAILALLRLARSSQPKVPGRMGVRSCGARLVPPGSEARCGGIEAHGSLLDAVGVANASLFGRVSLLRCKT
jgi:hypothetical protein